MSMGDRIRKSRMSLKSNGKPMTQQGLADITGISRVTITQLESGHVKSIDGENLLALSDALGVTPAFIVRGEDDGKQKKLSNDIIEFRKLLDLATGKQPFVHSETFNQVLDGFLAANPDRRVAFADYMADLVVSHLHDPSVRASVREVALQTMADRYSDRPDIDPEFIENAAQEALAIMEETYGHKLTAKPRGRVLDALRLSIRSASSSGKRERSQDVDGGGRDDHETADL